MSAVWSDLQSLHATALAPLTLPYLLQLYVGLLLRAGRTELARPYLTASPTNTAAAILNATKGKLLLDLTFGVRKCGQQLPAHEHDIVEAVPCAGGRREKGNMCMALELGGSGTSCCLR
jgi:hypothetical protein